MPKALPEEVRERLLEAAETIVWRLGFAKMTVDEVASAVSISKGAVYRFFASKEALGDAVVARYTETMHASQIDLFKQDNLTWEIRLRRMLRVPVEMAAVKYRTYSHGSPSAATIFGPRQRAFARVNARQIALFADVIKAGQKAGEFRKGNATQMSRSLCLAISGCLPPYLWLEDPTAAMSEAENVLTLLLEGLKARER